MTRSVPARRWALVALFVLLASGAASGADVPFLTGRVVDNAEILKPATRDALTTTLKAHEQATGNQVAVLTVPTIGDDSIEGYATKVFENWKLGQKGKDNGVLVIVVPKDRKMRIEVGYGLEGTLPDAVASRIIRNVMTPPFKNGDYDKGVTDGVTAIIAQLEGKGDSSLANSESPASSNSSSLIEVKGPDLSWPMRILLGAFIFGIIGLFTFIGVMTPGVGWFLYVFLIPFWAMFPLVIIGARGTMYLLGTYVIGYPIAKLILGRTAWYQKAAHDLKTKGTTSVGGFVMSSGGSSSSSSSGGGGFSGGGGDSGGGGSSGSW
jgi:uncharacterized protein